MWSISLGLFATLDEHSSLAKQVGISVFAGIGIGQTLQPCVSSLSLLDSTDAEDVLYA